MSLSIESLVRPFQTVDVFAGAPRRGPVDPAPGAVVLEIGKDGTPKTFTGSFSFSTSGFMGQKHNEKRRVVQPVNVKNPDDPDQKIRLNALNSLNSSAGRGRNFQKNKYIYHQETGALSNSFGETVSLDTVEKVGGTIIIDR